MLMKYNMLLSMYMIGAYDYHLVGVKCDCFQEDEDHTIPPPPPPLNYTDETPDKFTAKINPKELNSTRQCRCVVSIDSVYINIWASQDIMFTT